MFAGNRIIGGSRWVTFGRRRTHGTSNARMRVINSDGSEASMCGNGLRTVARYLAENQEKSFTVETMFADLKVRQAPI